MGFTVNGTAINVFGSYGDVVQVPVTGNTFTLAWSGIPTSGGSQTMLSMELIDKTTSTYVNMSCPEAHNSPDYQIYLSWVGSFASEYWMYLDGCSSDGSLTFTSASTLSDLKISLNWSYNGSDSRYNSGGGSVIFVNPTPTKCTAPSGVSVSASEVSGDTAQLRFTEGAGGTLNTFEDYQIQYSDGSSSTPAGSSASWSDLTTGTSSPVSVSVPSTVGIYRSYRIRTRGSVGASYYSDWAYSTNTVRKVFSVSKPVAALVSTSGSRCEMYVAISSEITGATGAITYEWRKSGESTVLLSTTDPAQHLVISEASLSTVNSFYVRATATINGVTKYTDSDPVTFYYDPTFTDASNLRISPEKGLSATLIWTPGSLSSGGTVTHQLAVSRDSGMTYVVLASNANTPYTVTQAALEAIGVQEGDSLLFRIVASGNGNTGIPLTVGFTYTQESTAQIYAHYYDGTDFVPCVLDMWDGTQWVRCAAQRFDGSDFV